MRMRIFDRSRVEAWCGPTTVYHIVSEVLPWSIFIATVIALVVAWGSIPELIPMHSDYAGNITEWGGKNNLIWLCGVYFLINLTLSIVSFFPQSWNTGIHLGPLSRRMRSGGVREYKLTRDLLSDLRISMAALFSAMLLWTAFGEGRYAGVIDILVFALIAIPLIRYLVRMYLIR